MLSEARQIVELQVGSRPSKALPSDAAPHLRRRVGDRAGSERWLVARRTVPRHAPAEWLRWVVAGGLMLVATIAGVWLTVRRTPSKMAAALSIDQLFGLRERVVTSFALSPEEANTSAGQALLADVKDRVAKIKVSEKFPVRLPWVSALVPAGAAALALVALFYHPVFPDAQGAAAENLPIAPEAKKEINKKLDELVKKPKTPEKPTDRPKSEDLKRLEAKLDEIAKQPRDTTKQLRDRIKDMTPLEEEMKKLERDRTEKRRR